MPKLTNAVPKYRKHRASGQAIVSIGGRDFYLGPHSTRASKLEYDRLITEWLESGRQGIIPCSEVGSLSITELIARYWQFAKRHYRKNGRPTAQLSIVKGSPKPLRELYGRKPVQEFGPVALKAVRRRLVESGLCRNEVNRRVRIVKQVFRWGVAEEIVPPSVDQALRAVAGLRAGKTKAPDHEDIAPVPDAVVDKTLPHLPLIVADMVRFQRLTGCRPGEACILRPHDIDRTGDVWAYMPSSHKTEHHGKERVIHIGPKAQEVLRPYLLRPATSCCFSPSESDKKHRSSLHAHRRTPLSCGNRPGTNRKRAPKRRPGDAYTVGTYRQAIHRGCKRAGVTRWSPNRLRHSAATEIRKKFGLEAAQVSLGHASADISQIYAERDFDKAREVMRKIG